MGLRREVASYLRTRHASLPPADPNSPPSSVWQAIEKSKAARPSRTDIDQSALDSRSTRAKAAAIANRAVENDALLCLGDNDMLSVALSHSPLLRRIVVVDIDTRVLNDVRSLANSAGPPFETINEDLRTMAPLTERFQLVACDPPYTTEGFLLYLRHAAHALEIGGELFLTYPDMTIEAWNYDLKLAVQSALSAGGLVVEEITRHSQTFHDPYGIVASLMVARKTATGHIEEAINAHRIYTVR